MNMGSVSELKGMLQRMDKKGDYKFVAGLPFFVPADYQMQRPVYNAYLKIQNGMPASSGKVKHLVKQAADQELGIVVNQTSQDQNTHISGCDVGAFKIVAEGVSSLLKMCNVPSHVALPLAVKCVGRL